MNIKKICAAAVLLLIVILAGCNSAEQEEPAAVIPAESEAAEKIITERAERTEMSDNLSLKIDNQTRYQTIEGFGTSGAWWAQDVGNWDNIEEIMDLLYDKEKGIGLNIFRYNIGAGMPNRAADAWRRSETVEVSPGVYDLSRDEAAIKVFKLAAERGAVRNVAFVNSPPARMTVSGYTSGGNNKKESNLAVEYEAEFAKYCVDITRLLLEEGIPVKYLSPINEPQWDWGGKDASQEGCHYKVNQIVSVGRAVAEELARQQLPVKISLAESGEWKDAVYTTNLYTRLMRDDVLKEAMDHYSAHSYWSNESDKKKAAEFFQSAPDMLPLHQTEWCQMEWGKDLGMDAALVLAKEVHMDMTILSVVSWSHWLCVSKYDYKDGLVYVDTKNKTYEESRRMWALGNYSRFIKEDYVRIGASRQSGSLLVSAYESPDSNETVVVVINEKSGDLLFGIDNFNAGKTKVYITDRNNISRDVFEELDDVWNYSIPPRSVVTFVNSKS
jgi:O-glycosyl hydrolase